MDKNEKQYLKKFIQELYFNKQLLNTLDSGAFYLSDFWKDIDNLANEWEIDSELLNKLKIKEELIKGYILDAFVSFMKDAWEL